ncbi:uncharacterized protein LOC123658924 [Melitaea cinxia]|uniref:uncharacterized protein LOC123658924 n=1 Tax=Melitaea cinxia TaxID=113334 RepID=UPI001E26EBA3|nr:uncharacterized protein LOC123658924 [Melitaea cinxia]
METLIRLQKDIASAISRSRVNFKKSPKERLTFTYVEARLENLETQWLSFKDTHRKLVSQFDTENLDSSDYFEDDTYDLTEEAYLEYKSILKETLRGLQLNDKNNVGLQINESVGQNNLINVRLPKITIPTFSGNYIEWTSFRDLFVSLIHNNASLDNVQKLHYLKSHLSGEAEQLLRHIPITSSNYNLCWDQLENRYNNRRYIINCILKKFMSQRNIVSESSQSLRELLDNTNECMNALKNLNLNIDNWDVLIIYILCLKLDTESRRQWEAKVCNLTQELPTIDQFKLFLEQRFRSLEFSDNKNSKHCNKNVTAKSFHVTATACPYCKESHKLCFCKKFCKENIDSRRGFVQSRGLCFNCLGPNHSVISCHQSTRCRVCKKRHHSLLHPKTAPQQSEENNSGAKDVVSATSSQGESNVVTCFSSIQSQVLLATALVKVEMRSGATMTLRALLDQGSQASFITEAAVQLYGLKKIPHKSLISGLGSDHSGMLKSKYIVNLNIHSLHNSSFVLSIKAHVMSKLTSFLPDRKVIVNCVKGLSKEDLADPMFNVPNKIDLLLSAEVYAQILEDGLIKGPPGSPKKTRLGWILSGHIYSRRADDACNNLNVKIINMHTQLDDNELLRKFWELEAEPNNKIKILTKDEEECETIFRKTTRRDETGRYIVNLPFRNVHPRCKYGGSKEICERQFLNLEKRLSKNPDLKESYQHVLSEYLTLGHMEEVEPIDENDAVYLPHHAVVREDKSTTKVRVVFNASCKGSNGVSLNDELLVGPTLQPELRHLIMRVEALSTLEGDLWHFGCSVFSCKKYAAVS